MGIYRVEHGNKQSVILLCDKKQDECLNIYVMCDQCMDIICTSVS